MTNKLKIMLAWILVILLTFTCVFVLYLGGDWSEGEKLFTLSVDECVGGENQKIEISTNGWMTIWQGDLSIVPQEEKNPLKEVAKKRLSQTQIDLLIKLYQDINFGQKNIVFGGK